MTPNEFQYWKTQLTFAHNRWADAGWLVDQDHTSQWVNPEIGRFLDAYRGDMPYSLSGATETVDQMVGNIFFSIINTQTAQLSGRIPDPILRPLGGAAADPVSRRKAWLNEQLVEFMVRDRVFKREADQALLSGILTGGGFCRHGYTPDVEFVDDGTGKLIARFKNQTPDLPWVQFFRPWQIRIDPLVNSFAPDCEPRWVAFYSTLFEHQIRKNPNLHFRKDLTPTRTMDMRRRNNRNESIEADSPERAELYELWTIYDANERKFFSISPGSEKLIRESRDWPFEWGQLPYSYLAFNDQVDDPFPIPFPRMFWSEQLLYNKIWTIINAHVGRMRRMIFANKDRFKDDGQWDLLTSQENLMEFFGVDGPPADAIAEVGISGIDGQLIGLLGSIKEQIREVLGVSNFDRGQRANVETAAEANQIAAGGSIARSRTQERFEAFWTNLIQVSHRAFLQSSDARKFVIPILGKHNLDFLEQSDREQGFIEVSIEDLQGEFSYDVKLDSTLRTDPNTELARLSTAYNIGGGVQSQKWDQDYYHNRFAELGGADPEQAVISPAVQEQMAKNAQGQEGESPDSQIPAAAQQGANQGLRGVLGGAA